ncbi:MAG: hypothetical protein AAFN27_15275 [Pseudomonadota bacterium]
MRFVSDISDNERTLSSAFIALSMMVGLLFPTISEFLFEYLYTLLFLVIVFSFCTLNANILHITSAMSQTTWLAMLWQMFGIPSIVTLVCFLTNADFLTTSVVIATTTAGSVFASPALAHLVGLDRSMAIRKMLLSTFIMPISLLFFGELNGMISRDLSLFNYVQHVIFFLILPMVIAVSYWETSPRFGKNGSARMLRFLHWAATVTMMGFCCGMMSKLHGAGPDHYAQLAHYILLVAAIVVAIYAVTGMLFAHLGRRSALTLGMLAANRNVALSFALISDVLPKDVLVYVAIAQFPIFLSPIVVRFVQLLIGNGFIARHEKYI